MNDIQLYRRRYIPDEKVFLDKDDVLFHDGQVIVTKWTVLKPRKDFSYGYSYYWITQGIKISKFFDAQDHLVYIYCDMIETEYDPATHSYVFNDLLVDVIIYPDGTYKIMDMAELGEALEKQYITVAQLKKATDALDYLLQLIYAKEIQNIVRKLDFYIQLPETSDI